ncbi:MAG: RusA family crossover junction endodeoxyribonuclease [Nocardioidaceae bacterium]
MPRLPWEFVALGVPISVQASGTSKARWKAEVAAAAQAAWGTDPPLDVEVLLQLTYFHESAPLDVDNMIKPIQDALNGIVYVDDKQVARVVSGRSDLNGGFHVRGLSEALASGFVSDGPFVHIKVAPAPDAQELP